MKCSFDVLSSKEVINICDGKRLGHIDDLEIDMKDGLILAIIIPGPSRFFGFIRSEKDICIPFCDIVKIGEDVILVDLKKDHKPGPPK